MNYRCRMLIMVAGIAISQNVFAQNKTSYQQEIDQWHDERVNQLKADDGWLNLVGLFWLDEGKNSFGSGGQNKIVFPKGTITASAGYFLRTGNTVKLVANKSANIKVGDKEVAEATIFSDSSGTSQLSSGSLRWTIIKRNEKIGIRLRNLKSKQLQGFKGVLRFDVDPTWKLDASLISATNDSIINITNVLGQTIPVKSPGKLVFTINGNQYSLAALEEGDELFIIFSDSTSGISTYPSGRFVYAKKPAADGHTVLDFNKAYNPPCAFTAFATCPLPPKQNRMRVAITAGEKYEPHQ